MTSKILAAGIGRKHLHLSRLQVSVVGGGLTRHQGEVFVNPADYETAMRVFRPSVLDRALEASGDAFLLGSVVSSSFQGVALLGLLGGRGLGGSASELLERAFPELPSRSHYAALRLQMTVLRCELLARQLEARLSPGPGSSGGPGSGTRGQADADTDTEAVSGPVGEVPSVPDTGSDSLDRDKRVETRVDRRSHYQYTFIFFTPYGPRDD